MSAISRQAWACSSVRAVIARVSARVRASAGVCGVSSFIGRWWQGQRQKRRPPRRGSGGSGCGAECAVLVADDVVGAATAGALAGVRNAVVSFVAVGLSGDDGHQDALG